MKIPSSSGIASFCVLSSIYHYSHSHLNGKIGHNLFQKQFYHLLLHNVQDTILKKLFSQSQHHKYLPPLVPYSIINNKSLIRQPLLPGSLRIIQGSCITKSHKLLFLPSCVSHTNFSPARGGRLIISASIASNLSPD